MALPPLAPVDGMAYRSFTDSAGTAWEVWEVRPRGFTLDAPDRRSIADRRTSPARDAAQGRRGRVRRLSDAAGVPQGWLLFRSATERRRLAPVPPLWAEASALALEQYCRSAQVVRPGGIP